MLTFEDATFSMNDRLNAVRLNEAEIDWLMIAAHAVILWFSQRRSRQESRDGALLCVRTVHFGNENCFRRFFRWGMFKFREI